MKAEVDHVLRTGDSIGGVFEVVVHGAPAGLGTYANWDERLDGLLAWAVMSLQAVKAVEIGPGGHGCRVLRFRGPRRDRLQRRRRMDGAKTRFTREHNNAGGIEGGVSNGEDIVVRGYLKPISTLRRPLGSVSLRYAGGDQGGLRAIRCLRCACRRRGSGSDGRVRYGEAGAGKVWRRLGRRTQQKLPGIPGADSQILRKISRRMVYPIVKFPDPILQRPAEPVTVFDEDLKKLVDDMFESMYVAHGIGLAAPQIGIPKRLTVIDLSFQKTPEDKIALINPEVVTKEGKIFEEEGCLSLPDIREKVARAAKVKIRAQDVQGNWFEREADELLARAFQHEIDHLDGILFIFRISALKRDFVLRKIRKLQRAGEW